MPSLAHGRTEMAHIDNERREDRDLTRDGDGGALITQRRCAEVKRGREGGTACNGAEEGNRSNISYRIGYAAANGQTREEGEGEGETRI